MKIITLQKFVNNKLRHLISITANLPLKLRIILKYLRLKGSIYKLYCLKSAEAIRVKGLDRSAYELGL